MNVFSIIPEGQAILMSRGVYRQVPVYRRNSDQGQKIYAKFGGGFVRLSYGGATSAPNVRWSEVDPGDGAYEERGGAVFYLPAPSELKQIEAAE